jgi:hypothetical protein
MRIPSFCAVVLLCFACTTEEEALERRAIGQLLHNWQLKGQPSYEQWTQDSDEQLSGKGYTFSDGDTTLTEKLALVKRKNRWYYEVDLLGKQSPNEVSFALDSLSEHTLVFSNPEHDFPQTLTYHWPNDTIMQVTLTGIGNPAVYFVFKKR